MSGPKPKPGERWKVTLEGVVDESVDLRYLVLRTEARPITVRPDEGAWERLPDPEPNWRRGDAAVTASGTALIRTLRGGRVGWVDDTGEFLTEAFVRDHFGPLTRLVPEVTL